MPYPTIFLKKKKSEWEKKKHLWIFRADVRYAPRALLPGTLVEIADRQNEFIGVGYYNPATALCCRILSFEKIDVDRSFLKERLSEAFSRRKHFLSEPQDACRLVNAEGDGLPGLIIDKYSGYLVMQINTAGIENLKKDIIEICAELVNPEGIYEKSITKARELEGLDFEERTAFGKNPPERITISENALLFDVDVIEGQKTGFYLDQSQNRKRIQKLSAGRHVLDCFAYTGAFGVYSAKGGASSVTAVEISSRACRILRDNFKKNNLSNALKKAEEMDVFDFFRMSMEKFDLILLDPPPFAKSRSNLKGALRAYTELLMRAIQSLSEGGILHVSSCSAAIDYDNLRRCIKKACSATGKNSQELFTQGAGDDHPISRFCPEGEYLRALSVKVKKD